LHDLGDRYRHRHSAGDTDPQRPQRVVRVHQRVDRVVHAHHPPGSARLIGKHEETVAQCEHVMYPMKINELLFAEHNEGRVPQFSHFGPNEHQIPEHESTVVFVGVVTKRLNEPPVV